MLKTLKKPYRTAGLLTLLMSALIAIIISTLPVTGENLSEQEPQAVDAEAYSCRFGTTAWNSAQGPKLSELETGWYLNFTTNAIGTVPENTLFTPMLRLKQDKIGDDIYLDSYTVIPELTDDDLGWRIDANPGATWIIGNEPDRGPTSGSSGQDDMMPDMYARALHDVSKYIKDRDPSAQIASAGLVQITPGRLQYLDMVAEAYYSTYNEPLPVDIWTMHLYIMPETRTNGTPSDLASVAVGTDPALGMRESGGASHQCGNVNNNVYCFADHDNLEFFERQIRDMRTWMKKHGHRNKPLLITEYSILYNYELDPGGCFLMDEYGNCFDQARVSNHLRNTFDKVYGTSELSDPNLGLPQDNNRLVQQVMWFAMYTTLPGKVSNLYTSEALTSTSAVGKAFQAETAERTLTPNLLPLNAASVTGFITPPASTTTVTLSVDIVNNGDVLATSPVTVTFYDDEAMTPADVIDSDTISNIEGCAHRPVTASVEWSGLPSGVHQYWVKIDSGSNLVEISELDNTASGLVIIDPGQNFLPITEN